MGSNTTTENMDMPYTRQNQNNRKESGVTTHLERDGCLCLAAEILS